MRKRLASEVSRPVSGDERRGDGSSTRLLEVAVAAITVVVLVAFFAIPALWALGELEGQTFWVAQVAFVGLLGLALYLVRRLKRKRIDLDE